MKLSSVINIIKKSPAAQLATIQAEGYPEVRALLNLPNEKKYPKLVDKAIEVDGETVTMYFTTNTSSRKVAQIRKNNKVCMYFCIPEKFKGVSLIGEIAEVTDMKVKKDFWHKEWLMYYHKGSEDPDYALLKFTSKHIHCWGNLGLHDFGEEINEE